MSERRLFDAYEETDKMHAYQPNMVFLLMEILKNNEIEKFDLSRNPSWVEECYGVQVESGTLWGSWRNLPQFAGRFHPEFTDDLEILIHDGGPRLTDCSAELVWGRITVSVK